MIWNIASGQGFSASAKCSEEKTEFPVLRFSLVSQVGASHRAMYTSLRFPRFWTELSKKLLAEVIGNTLNSDSAKLLVQSKKRLVKNLRHSIQRGIEMVLRKLQWASTVWICNLEFSRVLYQRGPSRVNEPSGRTYTLQSLFFQRETLKGPGI